MNLSRPFILRPVATTLLTLGITLSGLFAYFQLPVAPLPQVDFPTIMVTASMAGASPETMATSVATPLERRLGVIADVSEMTSQSSLGQARITLQFGLKRDIDGAARDVQAAINAARADLPAALKSNPTYRKMNPADAPILILALTSPTLTQGQLYDSAATVLQQKLSQVEGVGQANIGGASLPAVRVEINPHALTHYGITLEDVRAALAAANANRPKGLIEDGARRFQIYTNDQAFKAEQYRPLVIAERNGLMVRLADIAQVIDSVEDVRNQGLANGKPSVVLLISRQPGANIIETVDRIKALLPELRQEIPSDIDLTVVSDHTPTIRASLAEVQRTLLISVVLVVLVVFLFLRDLRSAIIPSVAVPVSLIGTFAVMYLLGYSLDNVSMMALTVATGFVVDDAIVVLENVSRHLEAGEPPRQAAIKGAGEVGFTVVAMSLSLIAVFVPILFMGGMVGRIFHEFAVTMSVAILVSLVLSLTTTPMMCAYLLRRQGERRPGRLSRLGEAGWNGLQQAYGRSLAWALRHTVITFLLLVATLAFNVHLFAVIPKGFFPQQDTGRLMGSIQADQSISFQSMRAKLQRYVDIIGNDPAVATVVGYTGGGRTNSGFIFATLKPRGEREASGDEVVGRLRGRLAQVPGATLYLQAMQDFRAGGRQSNAQFQYTLQGDDLRELYTWTPRITEALRQRPELTDVSSDEEQRGQELALVIDRAAAARLGLTINQIDNTLYDAFGQRQVSTIYRPLNQYHVVMEVAPRYWQDPEILKLLHIGSGALNSSTTTSGMGSGGSAGSAVNTSPGTLVPLAAVANYENASAPLSVNHQGLFAATTISFNLAPDRALGDAVKVIDQTMAELMVPASVRGGFQGTAKVFQESFANQPLLILAALVTVYIVLGILYESLVHPITILSTLPSAGVGALLALMVCRSEFSIIALIGIILLIGIVKKNAIMMIDVAVDLRRNHGVPAREAIYQACLIRFRPILMTSLAAALGALPLAFGHGEGAELRVPLGISIVGGLLVSQLLTLYTTPVVYLYLDRLATFMRGGRPQRVLHEEEEPGVTAPVPAARGAGAE